MSSIDSTFVPTRPLIMPCHLDPSMVDPQHAAAHHHLDLRTDQAPRNAVVVGVDVNAAVVRHAADHLAYLSEWRTPAQETQRQSLLTLKTYDRRLTGRAVYASVGHLAHPPCQMRLQRCPACEASPGNG